MRILRIAVLILVLASCGVSAGASVFGEVAVSLGGTWPQGSFARYSDPGPMLNLRATIHIPKAELFVGWADLSIVQFKTEEIESTMSSDLPGSPVIPITQSTSESLFAAHLGLQLGTTTKRAFFRPRAAIGVGVYNFWTKDTWSTDVQDTTITLDSENKDTQTVFGWRGMIGADMFITPQIGITADFVYDHVLGLNQFEGPKSVADRTSRFHGFTVGVVYMFRTDKP